MAFLNFEKHLLFLFVFVTGILQRQTKLLCLAWKYVNNLANFNGVIAIFMGLSHTNPLDHVIQNDTLTTLKSGI